MKIIIKMVIVSKLLEWSRINSSLTMKSKLIILCYNYTCKTGINIIRNTILCNNFKKLINIFKETVI